MEDDDVDHDLLDFMRKAMGLDSSSSKPPPPSTKVLESAQFIFDNAIDVALDPNSVKQAAESIYQAMQIKSYSTATWSEHELHPKERNEDTVNFIFTMDVLNFSFWSDLDEEHRFAVDYAGRRWTGYWSLVALLRRALDEGLLSVQLFAGGGGTVEPRRVEMGLSQLVRISKQASTSIGQSGSKLRIDTISYAPPIEVLPHLSHHPLSPSLISLISLTPLSSLSPTTTPR